MIKAQQGRRVTDTGHFQRLCVGPILNDYLDVFELGAKSRRQCIPRFLNQGLKFIKLHPVLF